MTTQEPAPRELAQDLIDSCATGNLEQLPTLLEQAKNFEISSVPTTEFLLVTAAENGQSEIIRHLFETLPECQISRPWEPIWPENLESRNVREEWSISLGGVVLAALEGKDPIAVFKVFFNHEMNANYVLSYFGSLLSNAMNRPDFAQFLLENGANPNRVPGMHDSFLYLAALKETPDVINLLIEHGADIKKSYALRGAVMAGRINNTRRLLELGADVNEPFLMKKLSPRGVPGLPHKNWVVAGYPLHFAIKGMGYSDREEESSDREEESSDRERDKPADLVRLLLENGARIDDLDYQGKTPLDVARKVGDSESVKVLEEHEARLKERFGIP